MNETNSEKENKSQEEQFPGVENAYSIALKSYDWAIQRSDSIDDRIDKMLVLVTTINIGVIAVTANKILHYQYKSLYLYFAVGLYLLIMVMGFIVKFRGSLSIIAPDILYAKYLQYHKWEFQKNIIFWSGEDFNKNQRFVNWKGSFLNAIIISFFIEIMLLVLWLVTLYPPN